MIDQEDILLESVAMMSTQERREYANELERLTYIIRASLPEFASLNQPPVERSRGLN